jgi:hypothetical protein
LELLEIDNITTVVLKLTKPTEREKMKIMSSKELTAVNTQSTNYKFNRTLDKEFINHLDPDGLSVVDIVLFQHNSDFAEIAHHRCRVLAKFENTKEPVEVFLDIAQDTYDRLATLNDVVWKDTINVG